MHNDYPGWGMFMRNSSIGSPEFQKIARQIEDEADARVEALLREMIDEEGAGPVFGAMLAGRMED